MDYKLKFKRGEIVKSMRDGVEGVITGFIEHYHSGLMFSVDIPKPKEKQEYKGELHGIYVDEIELINALDKNGNKKISHPDYVAELAIDFKYPLNVKAKNICNGCTGLIISRSTHANGCHFYTLVTEEWDKTKGEVIKMSIPEKFIELLEPLKVENHEIEESLTTKKIKPGGPREKVNKMF